MKLEKLIWDEIPAEKFYIIRSNISLKGSKISFKRDSDFQINFELSITSQKDYFLIQQEFTHLNRPVYIVAQGIVPNIKIIANQVYPEASSAIEGNYKIIGKVVSLTYYIKPKKNFSEIYSDSYYLNNLSSFFYPSSLRYSIKEEVTLEIDNFSSEVFELEIGGQNTSNILNLEVFGKKIVIGAVSKDITNSHSGTFIRTESKNSLSKEETLDLQNYLSFMGGSTFVFVGNAKVASYYTKPFRHFQSTFIKGIEHHLKQSEYIPYPYKIYSSNYQQIERKISSGFEKYLEIKNIFDLNQISFLISYARISSLELQIQPLATAYDLLKAKWFKSSFSLSKGKNLQDEAYSNIIEKYIQNISEDLDNNKPTTKAILNRIKKANEMSLSEKDTAFFDEMNFEFSDIEKFALLSRHKIVHGNHGSKNIQNIIDANRAYHTLVNRIVLYLLGFDQYVDHSYLAIPTDSAINKKMLGPLGTGKTR